MNIKGSNPQEEKKNYNCRWDKLKSKIKLATNRNMKYDIHEKITLATDLAIKLLKTGILSEKTIWKVEVLHREHTKISHRELNVS